MQQIEENQYAKKCRATLIDKIVRFGAITTEDFMAHCLTDPQCGYYRHAKLGQDFITAPMLSQEFGSAVGAWVELSWKRLRKPRKVMLVEAGAGRGELLHDVLYYLQENCREIMACLCIQLVEINQSLRQKQAQVLAKFANNSELQGVATWHENLEDVPEGTSIFIANEFFDALPTRQYVLSPSRSQNPSQSPSQSPSLNPSQSSSCEHQSFMRRIAIDKQSAEKDYTLQFVRAEQRALPPILLNAVLQEQATKVDKPQKKQASQEKIVEVSPRTLAITANLVRVLALFGGAVFICDYGYLSQKQAKKSGSLQAFFRHKVVDPLLYYGACDLSTEVDFQSIANEFRTLQECNIVTQREFLQREFLHGESLHGESLHGESLHGEFLHGEKVFGQKSKKSHAAERNKMLVAKNAMGEHFKVLTAFSNR